MKTILSCCLVIILAVSCQMKQKQNQNSDDSIAENMSVDGTETCIVDTVKATAIFWIDKSKDPLKKEFPLPIRSVKTKVDIDAAGKVKILSYVKPQDGKVRKYIQHRMKTFRVSKMMLYSGFVKTGEQYVQLRYMPEKMPK